MTEFEARKIFDLKLSLCATMGLDVRAACVDAGVPLEMVDKFIAADRTLTNAMRVFTSDPAFLASAGSTGRGTGFSCLSQKHTGLPMIIWVMARSASTATPYIRVQTDHSAIPQVQGSVRLSIGENPSLIDGAGLAADDMRIAAAFIRRNRDALLDQWNGVGDPSAFVERRCADSSLPPRGRAPGGQCREARRSGLMQGCLPGSVPC
jgi:hypothetical protein